MRRKPLVVCAACIVVVAGCASKVSYTPMNNPEYHNRPKLEESLFMDDQDVMSNEAINEVLNSRIELPGRLTIAVQEFQSNWCYARQQAERLDVIAKALAESGDVTGVTAIPDLLLRRKRYDARGYSVRAPGIPDFREAAARLQCELVLFYKVTPDVRYRDRFLRKDKAKVFTTVEGMLLHTRTGIFPFTALIDKEYEDVEIDSDGKWRTFYERARREATVAALRELAKEIAGFVKERSEDHEKDTPKQAAAPVPVGIPY